MSYLIKSYHYITRKTEINKIRNKFNRWEPRFGDRTVTCSSQAFTSPRASTILLYGRDEDHGPSGELVEEKLSKETSPTLPLPPYQNSCLLPSLSSNSWHKFNSNPFTEHWAIPKLPLMVPVFPYLPPTVCLSTGLQKASHSHSQQDRVKEPWIGNICDGFESQSTTVFLVVDVGQLI